MSNETFTGIAISMLFSGLLCVMTAWVIVADIIKPLESRLDSLATEVSRVDSLCRKKEFNRGLGKLSMRVR